MIKTSPPVRKLDTQSKPRLLHEHITALAYRLGPGAKLPKVAEMCQGFDVSTATLNRALIELEREGLIVRRHAVGIFVSEEIVRQAGKIALVCDPHIFHSPGHSPYWDSLLNLLGQKASEHGFTLECHFLAESPAGDGQFTIPSGLQAQIESNDLRGVLAIGILANIALWIMKHEVPLVTLYGKGHIIVGTGGPQQGLEAIQALRDKGCRKLGLWLDVFPTLPPRGQIDRIERLAAAFARDIQTLGLELFPELVERNLKYLSEPYRKVPTTAEQGFATARHYLSRPRSEWPDGVIIINDLTTRGALVAMRQMGIVPGQDLQIVSYANTGSPVLCGETGLLLSETDPQEVVQTMYLQLEELLTREVLPEDEYIIVPGRMNTARPLGLEEGW